jgi:hypothetical protein
MHRAALIAAAALALAACNKEPQAIADDSAAEEDFTSESIVANDVTAIDAATSDATNMAADVAPLVEPGNEGEAADSNESVSNRG